MSFDYISGKHTQDKDLPERAFRLGLFDSIRSGTFYNVLQYRFSEETTGSDGQYVKLEDRRPNTTFGTNLITETIDDMAAMLFGDKHFPEIETSNVEARNVIKDWIAESGLVLTMTNAAKGGSIGSYAVHLHLSKSGRIHTKGYKTVFLTPVWNDDDHDVLDKVIEKYPVLGSELRSRGYAIHDDDLAKKFWFQRIWDGVSEAWFLPWLQEDEEKARSNGRSFSPTADQTRSVDHRLGFCPWVWIKNPDALDDIDGDCWFRPAIETSIFLDYLVSQGGRGLKYSSDPMLMIKEPASPEIMGTNGLPVTDQGGASGLVKSPASVLTITSTREGQGDAKYLEIDGSAAHAILEYAEALRGSALGAMHGNRHNPDKLVTHGGAKALEILNASMLAKCGELRNAYGEMGLKAIIKMFLRIVAKRQTSVIVNGQKVPDSIGVVNDISLRWGAYYDPTAAEVQACITGYSQAIDAGFMSRERAVKCLAAEFDIEDVAAELALIKAETAAEDARLMAMQAQTQAKATITP